MVTNIEELSLEETNIYQEFRKAAGKYASNRILGVREKLSAAKEIQSDGKTLRKFTLAPHFTWMIYSDVLNIVDYLSNGLLSLGLRSNENIVLYAETRPEWLISALACFRIKVPIVTLYATLGIDALCYGINQTKTKFVITTGDQMDKLTKIMGKIPTVSHIVVVCDKGN